jgi:hypothetical protein
MKVTRRQDSFVTAARHSVETLSISANARADLTWRLTMFTRSTDMDDTAAIHATRATRHVRNSFLLIVSVPVAKYLFPRRVL